ncbi:MAG TPA: adenylyl-sulfate kinase, partial [Bacteroidetes bacterium]|nr:adenylyl-sulfate kinase [Bacteroidota bacterium]
DNVRHGLNKDLGFSDQDRKENIRRISEAAKLMLEAGVITLTAFISPFKEEREFVRNTVGKSNFFEVFVDCPIEECENRDVKGLYKKARAGEIPHFTGISSPYEVPENPDIIIDTSKNTVDEAVQKLIGKLEVKFALNN